IRRADGARILFCRSCGMGTVHPVPDDLPALYDDRYFAGGAAPGIGYADYVDTAEHGAVWAAALVEALNGRGRVLDVGCADGRMLKRLGRAVTPFGIEMNEAMAAKAARNGVSML